MSKKIQLKWFTKTGTRIVMLPIKLLANALDESKSIGRRIKRLIK